MTPPRITAIRVPIDAQGYDANGAYWGDGQPLYMVTLADGREQFVRAADAAAARVKAKEDTARSGSVMAAEPRRGADDRSAAHKEALRERTASYQIAWTNPVDRTPVTIAVRHTKNYLVEGTDHIEIEAKKPRRARLPITETGYLSHFIDWRALSDAGGPVTFVTAWLERECRSKAWLKREQQRAQGDLFQWADAREVATQPKRSSRPKAKRKLARQPTGGPR